MPIVSILQIHQAYFGAVNGTSHGQLASSLPDNNLRSFLSAFTDRPGVPPAGFELQPYMAATIYEGYYLICRTWPDKAVSRMGMVFTHVLIVPLQNVPKIPKLESVTNLLLDEPLPVSERSTSLAPLALSITDSQSNELTTAVPKSWLAVISQLIEQSEPAPVFILGRADHFQKLLETLWRGLPATLRVCLSWGIRFSPPALKESVPALVNVPDELEAKWRGRPVIKLATDYVNSLETPIEQLILNGEQGHNFRDFIESLEVTPNSFRSLKLCQRAYEQSKSLQAVNPETGKLLALLRTLRQLQPAPEKAVGIKRRIVQALTVALPVDGAKEAMGLRNVPIEPFLAEAERLEQSVEQVVRKVITAAIPDETTQKNLLGYLADTASDNIETWWRKVALSAFAQTLVVSSVPVARVVWLGFTQAEKTRNFLLSIVPNAAGWEQTLSETTPVSLTAAVADAVTNFSAGRNWWDLFASAVGAAYKPVEALRKQLTAEKHLNIPISPRVSKLAKMVPEGELVELAVELPNAQLLEFAGEVCGRDPKLLASIDVSQQSWRTIWSVSLSHTKSITAGLSKPTEIINAFLSEVAHGRASDAQPLELIAASAFANVLHLKDRTALWDKLPPRLQPMFLAATLDELVEEILTGKSTDAVDPILITKSRSIEFVGKFLEQKRNDPAAVLAVNAVFQNLSDSYLKDYINNLAAINGFIAVQIGKLVALHCWNLTAKALLNRARYNSDFRPALSECADMFSRLDKFIYSKLFGHQVTKSDAWNALEDLMINLYEEGPDQGHIWKKAGGDVTKLNNVQSRGGQWTTAIGLLRNGGGGKNISPESLIRAALEDYKNNSSLQALASSQHLFKL